MKNKFLLLGLMGLSLSNFLHAQTTQPTDGITEKRVAHKDMIKSLPVKKNGNISGPKKVRGFGNPSVEIGQTRYDLQSNGSMSRRIVNNGNNKVSAVWTMSQTSDPFNGAFGDRGTGYNSNNGTSWLSLPATRVENFRTGFAAFGTLGTEEFLLSHSATGNGAANTQGIYTFKNGTVGSSNFTYSGIVLKTAISSDTILWPKMAIAGDYIYVIGSNSNSADTTKTGLKFTMSANKGVTWSAMAEMPGITVDSIFRISADAYNISAKDSIVAVVIGDALTNGYIITSRNYGVDWSTKAYIRTGLDPQNNPFKLPTKPVGDTVATFVPCPDGTQSVFIENDNSVSVIYSLSFGRRTDTMAADVYTPNIGASANLCYWNESFDANSFIRIDSFVDCNQDGEFTLGDNTNIFGTTQKGASYGGNCVSNYAQVALAGDTIYVVYSSQMDDDTTTQANNGPVGQTFRDIMLSVSTDAGNTWNSRVNLSNSPGVEDAFPSIAELVDNNIHIIWQQDDEPGTILTNGDDQGIDANSIRYLKLDKATFFNHALAGDRVCWDNSFIPFDIKDIDANGNAIYSVYPNPAKDELVVKGDMQNKSIKVVNAFGQEFGVTITGTTANTATLNIANLTAGVYSINISDENGSRSVKFIKD